VLELDDGDAFARLGAAPRLGQRDQLATELAELAARGEGAAGEEAAPSMALFFTTKSLIG
jgi:hypothetical protein